MALRALPSRWLLSLFFACCLGASPILGNTIVFSGLDGTDVSDADGQTFAWTYGSTSGTVTLTADWDNLPDQGGPIQTATQGPATLANPFVGTLTLSFSEPVQVSLLATYASLLNDGLDGGRFERVTFSTSGNVVFSSEPGTTAIYSGVGTSEITADDEYSEMPTTSDWGFVGHGLADTYTLVYTSSRVGFSETFDVNITDVPEPTGLLLLGTGILCLAVCTKRRREV